MPKNFTDGLNIWMVLVNRSFLSREASRARVPALSTCYSLERSPSFTMIDARKLSVEF